MDVAGYKQILKTKQSNICWMGGQSNRPIVDQG
jgi:hypothetical protein